MEENITMPTKEECLKAIEEMKKEAPNYGLEPNDIFCGGEENEESIEELVDYLQNAPYTTEGRATIEDTKKEILEGTKELKDAGVLPREFLSEEC